jgi:membrane-bound inhibitor of C-type lysozyme
MVLGAVWCPETKRLEITQLLREIKARHKQPRGLGIIQLPARVKIAPVTFTYQCHDRTHLEAKTFKTLPHVIPPRMLSVIRDQGPCDL